MMYPHILIEQLLERFAGVLGKDIEKYTNHVCRVFLNCIQLDPVSTNNEKYAIAAVFHDIGIWTNHTFDYLDPSIHQLQLYLVETGKQEWITEITGMIYWHHKIKKYKGDYESTVDVFRKADWIDVSLGLRAFGADKNMIRENRRKLPNRGFHLFLIRQTIRNFFRHPLNPIPVLKR